MEAEFFETFKLLNGQLCNREFHLERIRKTQARFFENANFAMSELYRALKDYPEGLFKVRVDYASAITNIRAELYEIKPHHRLAIMDVGTFEYPFKYSDREFFRKSLSAYPDCDDLLYVKDGFLTDTSYCNIALFDGKQWVTPTSFLLPGTKRAALLAGGALCEKPVSVDDLSDYEAIVFINAMRDFEKKYTFIKHGHSLLLKEL